MRSTSNPISEGMWQGDLNDLMLPIVSIDEYASKVDDEAIVIGYYVHDIDAANDLNRFLQKSSSGILDTEVSPAPDQKGYYIVFVEMLRNAKTAQAIVDITKEVTSLCAVEKWKMSVFGSEGTDTITLEKLEAALAKAKVASKKREKKDTLKRAQDIRKTIAKIRARVDAAMVLLRNSQITEMRKVGHNLVLNDGRSEHVYEVLGVGGYNLLRESGLDNTPISVDGEARRSCRDMVIGLGEDWDALLLGECFVLQRRGDERILILKEI